MTNPRPGYDVEIVLAFLHERGIWTKGYDRLLTIDGHRVTDSRRDMVDRWRRLERVPLHRFDKFLLTYGVMLWEFEHWATERFGHDGFIDPEADPKELVA